MRRTADYQYDLPPARIAQVPTDRRDASRLLAVGPERFGHHRFAELPALLPRNAVLVINDTQVVPARLRGHKSSGGAVELLLLGPAATPARWRCLARSSKPLRPGHTLTIAGATATVVGERDAAGELLVDFDCAVDELCESAGELPLPPYIERQGGPTSADAARYQTVYARHRGAVAAPTAGLHFTVELIDALVRDNGVSIAPLTLHVGPGTFQPVRADAIDDHHMHAEPYRVPAETAALVQSGRPVVAVGTTAVRTLEAAARAGVLDRRDESFHQTNLFITPGFDFRVVTHLITNFHLPGSTLLMLVCALGGYQRVMDAYREALAENYRFYSYGDAMLVPCNPERT